jgi:hypothetical protein
MRSVVVVLPASICAMIPMFRVFWREYLRGMRKRVDLGVGKKNGPLGPARTSAGWSRMSRYVLEVSILAL